MVKVISITLFLAFLGVTGCYEFGEHNKIFDFTELAMKRGMLIEASNKNGNVSIEYISPLERRYKWNGHEEIRELIPRKVRWRGLLGAYDPAASSVLNLFKTRIVAEDSQIDFENYESVYEWLHQSSKVKDWVYNDTGLVVGFMKSPDRNQVNIEVYQILINGEKPAFLKGSNSSKISVKINN